MIISARKLEYLSAIGVQVWEERGVSVDTDADALSPSIEVKDLEELSFLAADCQRCEASKIRRQVIVGTGPSQADWLVVGGFLSDQDDMQAQAFTDHVARLLSDMLSAVGIKKAASYLTTSVKCHSTDQTSQSAELTACRAYLIRQIELVQPKIIFVLGEQAAQSLLKSDVPLIELQGKLQSVDDVSVPVVVSYHPQYLLQTPSAKRQAWADIQLAKAKVNSL